MMFIDFAGEQTQTRIVLGPRGTAQALPLASRTVNCQLRAEFVRSPEQVLEEVYAFVGVSRAKYCPLPPGMQVFSIPAPIMQYCRSCVETGYIEAMLLQNVCRTSTKDAPCIRL